MKVCIPLGLVTNAVSYGSLYGRGPAADHALNLLRELLAPHNLTVDDVRKAVHEGRYQIRRRV